MSKFKQQFETLRAKQDAELIALRGKGWTKKKMAAHLGISRQALHMRELRIKAGQTKDPS